MIIIGVDIQFKALRNRNLVEVPFNIVSREKHVKKIERWYHVIKERARCYYAMLPFDALPMTMVIYLMKTVVFYVNAFV